MSPSNAPAPPGTPQPPHRPTEEADPAPTVAQLRDRLVEFARVRDWGRYHTPKNLAMALSVEASELVEIFQWLTPEESVRITADPERAQHVREEVADVLAYLLQFCATLDIDPLTALADKIDRNEKRFPPPDTPATAGR
ncbi:nucleotide pyrophosphohydrolase [Streptomyces sp. NPDC002454]